MQQRFGSVTCTYTPLHAGAMHEMSLCILEIAWKNCPLQDPPEEYKTFEQGAILADYVELMLKTWLGIKLFQEYHM